MTIKIKSCLGRNFHKKVVENKPSWDDDNIYSYLKLTKPPWQPQWKKPEPVFKFRKLTQEEWDDIEGDSFDFILNPDFSSMSCNVFHTD